MAMRRNNMLGFILSILFLFIGLCETNLQSSTLYFIASGVFYIGFVLASELRKLDRGE